MKKILRLEVSKILSRKSMLVTLIVTSIIFPLGMNVISYLSVTTDKIAEGLQADQTSLFIFHFIHLYLFLPVWIFIFIGQEFSKGHVNRVVFLQSRKFYFLSKLFYCFLISTYFTILGLITLIIALTTSPYELLEIGFSYYLVFTIQLFFTNLAYSLLLLSAVFIIRSPVKSFVIYLVWGFLEGMIILLMRFYSIDFAFLPIQLVRSLYVRNGIPQSEDFYSWTIHDIGTITIPILFVTFLTLVTYRIFQKRDIKALSD